VGSRLEVFISFEYTRRIATTAPTGVVRVICFLTHPDALLHGEGAALALLLYPKTGETWLLFFVGLFAPDISMLGYQSGPRFGAALYNPVHSLPLPAVLAVYGMAQPSGLALAVSLIWFAHIGIDRLLGYGLKHPTPFQDTHLGGAGTDGATVLPGHRSS
jgi:hypothetical protein